MSRSSNFPAHHTDPWPRTLVVDESPHFREYLEDLLQTVFPLRVFHAENFQEALEALRRESPLVRLLALGPSCALDASLLFLADVRAAAMGVDVRVLVFTEDPGKAKCLNTLYPKGAISVVSRHLPPDELERRLLLGVS